MTLLELLKSRFEVAKAFTKEFHEEVQKCVEDYELVEDESERLKKILSGDATARYHFKVPYIFATHESMLSSMFDKVPDLIFRGRGKEDKEKKAKIEAIYDYLVDKLALEDFMTQSAWWFVLTGFASAHGWFVSKTNEVPLLDEMTGEPVLDELGQPIMRTEYAYNDPMIEVYDPLKVYFSPESEFTNKADKVPYYFHKSLMEIEKIQEIFGKKVDPDSALEVKGLSETKEKNDDIKRATVYFYYGTIPEAYKSEVKEWMSGSPVYAVYTANALLHTEMIEEKPCRLAKWHGAPNKFFGFGIGKTLRSFQKELGIRRSQQIRYADVAAFPKLVVDGTAEIDKKAMLDPRENTVVLYREKKPEYLVAPDISNTLVITEQKAREDAQFVSGLLDLSKGAQESSVVKTATGQTIFANAAEKRIAQAKRQFGRFYKDVITLLLKLCQQNWDEEKLIEITDDQGNAQTIPVSAEDLAGIDLEKDLDIDIESVTINKEVLRAQAIELYDRMKDDPLVDRKLIVEKVLRDGFNEKNPDQFVVDQNQMGMQPLANPQGQNIPTDQAGVLGQNGVAV